MNSVMFPCTCSDPSTVRIGFGICNFWTLSPNLCVSFGVRKLSIVSRAESVAASTPHMSPITRLQSQRHTPLPRPRHLESAPKPQVVDKPARDPGKGHVPQV